MLNKDGLLDEEIEEIKNAFKKYDINKTGKIDVKRFIKEMMSIGLDLKAPLIFNIFNEINTEEIALDEVLNIINDKIGNTKDDNGLKNIFELLKENKEDKYLSLNKMKELAISFGINITDEEIKNMLEKIGDCDNHGLDFETFCKIMKEEK